MSIHYEFITKEDLEERLQKNPLPIDNLLMSVPVFQGFTYFSTFDFSDETSENGTRFVIATDTITNTVVGVMKTKRYEASEHHYVSEEEKGECDSYVAIRYVNTHKAWRRKGIAKGLYQTLASFLEEGEYVVGSPLSNDGKQANLDQLMKKTLTGIHTYDNLYAFEEDYEEW